ncbi:MAG: VCBS repeat-containing protein [Polyangiaceae bacterium]|nr:VCBS repeat-containing protein [Polyangiaceae bacterium]
MSLRVVLRSVRVGALVVCASGCGGPAPCETASPWRSASDVAVSGHPIDVAIGDVDADGDLDLVTCDAREPSIRTFLGRGDGTFDAAPARPLSVRAHMLALADVDRDGDLDLVTTDHDSAGVSVALGDGAGAFVPAPGSPFEAHAGKPHNHGLAVGDVSGDGAADIVTANQEDHSVSVLLGDGAARFAPAAGSPIRLGAEPYVLRLADVDGDGRLDIVAPLIGGSAVAVLRGDGHGGFAHVPGSPFHTPERPYAITLAHADDDGRIDILAAHDDADTISVLLGAPGGTFAPAEDSPISLGQRVFVAAAARVDPDGVEQIVAGAGDRVLVLRRRAGRPLSEACRVDLEPSTPAWVVAVGDLDGDGRPDVVAPNGDAGTLAIWLSQARKR